MTDLLKQSSENNTNTTQSESGRLLIDADINEYVLGNIDLPIFKHRTEIESAIINNSVTIIVAPTGSGKTTQVPQFARELYGNNDFPYFDEIIVTQPRIVAARSVSERVTDEVSQTDQIHSVGYYTSKEGSVEPQRDQHIAFLTDGKAAAQLLHGHKGALPDSANRLLIIDEVHEWNLHIELLVAIIAKKTDPTSEHYDKNLKVVIMSATMDGDKLKKFFANINPPIIKVHVSTHEVVRSVSSKSVAEVALKLALESKGKVLAFHAGKREIASTERTILKKLEKDYTKDTIPVIPLHGQLSAIEQKKAFEEYPDGSVIATTNAAETSLTVPGAIAVVDSGEVRTDRIRYDLVSTGSEGLYLEDAPRANLNQRAGRVGRTAPGDYVLCSQNGTMPPLAFKDRPEYGTPSIQRSSLDGLLLKLKASGYDSGDFNFYHEPPRVALDAAKKRLFVLGALDSEGDITDRGLKMERLPLDPEFACMLIFAYEKGYNNEVIRNMIDIVAIMQRGGILSRSPNEQGWRELIAQDIYGDSAEKDSDYLVQLEAYVELMYHTDKEHWDAYDIIEHSVGLVEQGRISLAKSLGINLYEVDVVSQKNKQAVLACINAGQLNQLWRRNGEEWSLLLEPGLNYELSKSSVVNSIGQLVTGSLFTLGLRNETFDAVQNVNRVLNYESLEQSAGHLIKEVYSKDSAIYDPVKNELVVRVERKLGPLVLRVYNKQIYAESGSPEIKKLQDGHKERAWNSWQERKHLRAEYTIETITDAIANPESMQYGTDPITKEPLLAWRGGKGQWCRSKEIAISSLEAYEAQINKRPIKQEQKVIKSSVKSARAQLILLKNKSKSGNFGSTKTLLIKDLLSRISNTQEWLDEVHMLFSAE